MKAKLLFKVVHRFLAPAYMQLIKTKKKTFEVETKELTQCICIL